MTGTRLEASLSGGGGGVKSGIGGRGRGKILNSDAEFTLISFFFLLPFLWFGTLLVGLSAESKQRRHVSGAWCPSGQLGLAK